MVVSATFFIEGDTPSKKNSRRVFAKKGKIINIPSERYEAWHKVGQLQLRNQKIPAFKPPYEIIMTFWMKTNRRADLDNKMASVLDLLQDYGAIEDDCWQKLKSVKAVARGISKDNPRVKVEIRSETPIDKP